ARPTGGPARVRRPGDRPLPAVAAPPAARGRPDPALCPVQLPGGETAVRLRQGRRAPHPVPPLRPGPLPGGRLLGLAARLPAVRAGLPLSAARAGRPLLPGRRLPAAPGVRRPEGGLLRGRLLLRVRDSPALGGHLPGGLGLRNAGRAGPPPPGLRRPDAAA